jgi:hypothetical protein
MCVCLCFVSFSNSKHEFDQKNTVDVAIDSLKFLLLFEKRHLGTPSYKWEDTIQVDLEEMRCEDVNRIKHV